MSVDLATPTPAELPDEGPPVDDTWPDERRTRRFTVAMIVIAIAAAAIRFMNVLWWRPTTSQTGYHGYKLGGDAFYYHWQANALAKGSWFIDPFLWHFRNGVERPSATHPPLYVIYLSLWSRLGLDSVTWHRFASCFLGIAAVVIIGLVGRRIGGTTVGIVAAAIAAVYPQIWISDGMLLSESMAIMMTAIALYAVYGFARRPTMRTAVWMGLACGITALCRTELTLLFLIVVIPLALLARDHSWRERIKMGVVACLMGVVTVGPWIVFNYTRFEEPTTMTSATGAALVGRELRRHVLRQLHRLLRELLHRTVALQLARRVAA